jgi:hypothetical protein
MRKCLIGILFLLVNAPLALSSQNSIEWIKYTSAEGRYAVSLPRQPTLSTQEATTVDGQKFPQYLAAVLEPGDVAYMTGYFDYAPGTIFSADAARDGMVKRVNGTLISEKTISLGPYPGRDLRVLARAGGGGEYIVRARLYEAEKRVYVLEFILPKSLDSEEMNAKAAKYLDSFEVVKN